MKKIYIVSAIASAVLLLTACDKPANTRPEMNNTVVTAPAVTKPTVESRFDDAKIVTEVNAELVKDSELSAIKINVDSTQGRVVLKGTAPNELAKSRAETLAKATKDVVSVDNQLTVGASTTMANNPTMTDAKEKVVETKDKIVESTSNAYDKTKDKISEMSQNTKNSMSNPDSSVNKTVTKVENKLDDAAITVAVNAGLATDSELSALKINVDTKDGKVWLKGTAPSTTAKARASDIARGAKGVTSVENQLTVTPK